MTQGAPHGTAGGDREGAVDARSAEVDGMERASDLLRLGEFFYFTAASMLLQLLVSAGDWSAFPLSGGSSAARDGILEFGISFLLLGIGTFMWTMGTSIASLDELRLWRVGMMPLPDGHGRWRGRVWDWAIAPPGVSWWGPARTRALWVLAHLALMVTFVNSATMWDPPLHGYLGGALSWTMWALIVVFGVSALVQAMWQVYIEYVIFDW